jgi:hypothetical protein
MLRGSASVAAPGVLGASTLGLRTLLGECMSLSETYLRSPGVVPGQGSAGPHAWVPSHAAGLSQASNIPTLPADNQTATALCGSCCLLALNRQGWAQSGAGGMPDLGDAPHGLKPSGCLGHARPNGPRYAPMAASQPGKSFSLMHGSVLACGPSPHNRQTEVAKKPHRVCAEAILLLTLGTPGRIAGHRTAIGRPAQLQACLVHSP